MPDGISGHLRGDPPAVPPRPDTAGDRAFFALAYATWGCGWLLIIGAVIFVAFIVIASLA